MELNNIFPELNDKNNFIFIGKFDKHNDYKNMNLFKNFNINKLKSNTEWDCKLQTNFPGNNMILLKHNINKNLIDDILKFIQKEINDKKMLVQSLWYNIYKKGFNQERHNHKGVKAILSGVYYYKLPSKIRFYNPKDIKSEMAYEFEPEEGNVILFSSELEHSVPKYNGDDTRITFAFNLGYDKL
tara:strand:+ start:286 stop:840 length:555 start_codon:yes stop_codon:yes gene_type:complete